MKKIVFALLISSLVGCASKGAPPTAYDFVVSDAERRAANQSASQPEVAPAKQRAQARVDVSVAHFEAGNFDRSLSSAREAIEFDDNNSAAWLMVALAQEKMNVEVPSVISTYEKAVSKFPGNVEVQQNYGWYLCQKGVKREGVEWLSKASKNLSNKSPAKTYLALSKCGVNLTENIEFARKALDNIPNWPEGWLTLADLYLKNRRLDLAHQAMGKYFSYTDTPSKESYQLGLTISEARGDSFQAEQYRKKLKNVVPHRVD